MNKLFNFLFEYYFNKIFIYKYFITLISLKLKFMIKKETEI